jgi:hypothetical protein
MTSSDTDASPQGSRHGRKKGQYSTNPGTVRTRRARAKRVENNPQLLEFELRRGRLETAKSRLRSKIKATDKYKRSSEAERDYLIKDAIAQLEQDRYV